MKKRELYIKENDVRVICNVSLDEVFKEFFARMTCIHDNLFEAIDNGYEDYADSCCNELVAFIIISNILKKYVKTNGIDLLDFFVDLDVVVHRGKNNEQ